MLNIKNEDFKGGHIDVASVKYIKRIVIGNTNAEQMRDERFIESQMNLLNRCLSQYPKGVIIGTERNFTLLRIGEHQVVLQSVAYHVGFPRYPRWLDEVDAHDGADQTLQLDRIADMLKKTTG